MQMNDLTLYLFDLGRVVQSWIKITQGSLATLVLFFSGEG